MKKLFLTLASITLFGTVFATPFPNQSRSNNSFVFNEQGIEFAVFKDGQFDFNVLRHCQGLNRYSNHKGINICRFNFENPMCTLIDVPYSSISLNNHINEKRYLQKTH